MGDKDEIIYRIRELDPDIIAPSTKRMNVLDQGGSKIVAIGKPGCFEPGTKILMYDGTIKNVEDIRVGDTVMGDDSSPRNVLELCHNFDEMYKMTPVKGDAYTINKQHILTLKCTFSTSTFSTSTFSTGCTDQNKNEEIIDITVEDFLKKNESFQKRYKWFRTSVEFPTKKNEFDPYIIGAWLGDDTSCVSNITDLNKEVLDYFEQYFTNKGYIFKKNPNSKFCYSICSKDGTEGKNGFKNFLRENNLLDNKHIPFDYKVNSRDGRLALLAGILDTNGCFDIVQKNEKLMDDIVFVARSVGFSARQDSYTDSKNPNHRETYYTCHISGDGIEEIPTKIFHKIASKQEQIKDTLNTDFTLKYVGEGEYFGFCLDGNNRFILGDFSVTHNSGKSYCISSLIYEKSHIFPVGIAMNGTEDSNHHYAGTPEKPGMFPPAFVYDHLDKEKLEDVIKRQKLAKEHLPNPWAVVVIDDCMDDPKQFNDTVIQNWFKNGRHFKTLFILGLQYCMDVRPGVRVCIDGALIFRESNIKFRKILWENYASVVGDFAIWNTLMDELTDDHTAIYIHNATTSNKIEDCVFWYKAKPVPPSFRIGSQDFWEYNNERYDPTSYNK